MDKETLLKLLSDARITASEESKEVVDIEEHIGDLKRRNLNLSQKTTFVVGDVVRWKDGLKNRRIPEYKMPAVVVEVLEIPFYDDKADTGSPYYREPLDVLLGIIVKNQFLTFYYDSRRFEIFEKK